MRSYIDEPCDQIDAAMFSGDAFLDGEHRKELRDYMASWERELKRFDDLEIELAELEPNT